MFLINNAYKRNDFVASMSTSSHKTQCKWLFWFMNTPQLPCSPLQQCKYSTNIHFSTLQLLAANVCSLFHSQKYCLSSIFIFLCAVVSLLLQLLRLLLEQTKINYVFSMQTAIFPVFWIRSHKFLVKFSFGRCPVAPARPCFNRQFSRFEFKWKW